MQDATPNPATWRYLTKFRRKAQAGSTLAEVLVATTIAALGFTGLCVANANCLGIARSHKEILVANQCLEQRSEQCRAANWRQVTDANALCGLLAVAPANFTELLPNQAEKITVNAYPATTPAATPIVVTRDANGTVAVVSQPGAGFYLRNSLAVRIDFQEAWTSAQGRRSRTLETSTVIALGGLLH